MASTHDIVFKINAIWNTNSTFDVTTKMLHGTKDKVDALNKSYRDQSKTIGQLKDKVIEWRKESDNSYRSDHIRKYNMLIGEAKRKIDELESSAKNCKEKTQSMFQSVFNANILIKGLDMAKNAVVSFVNESIEAYKSENIARTQLEQVMKNTMNAEKWDVDGIVRLTKAQEKLGVVSGDVQLAGSKELATYIKRKESLQELIPVMNDMLAHQYGLNASQESAQSIAQMMGKVLEGQVNALSRNGYSFTEAQEAVLKYGDESERVAVLAEVISQSVGGVNAALAATPEGKAKQIAMEYDEVKAKVGELAAKLQGDVMSGLKNLGIKLYENRELLAKIAKAIGTATVAVVSFKTAVFLTTNASKIWSAVVAAKTFTVNLFTGKLNLATRALHAFNTASKASIIGAITSVVLAAASAFAMFRKRAKDATESIKDVKDTFNEVRAASESYYAKERSQLDLIFSKLNRTNPKSEERKRLVKELSELYPELNKQTLDDITNTNNLADAYNNLIVSIQKKVRIKAKEDALEVGYKKIMDVEDSLIEMANGRLYGIPEANEPPPLEYVGKTFEEIFKELENELKEDPSALFFGKDEADRYFRGKKEVDKLLKQIEGMQFDSNGSIIFEKGGGGSPNANPQTQLDTITGGGKSMKNIYINLENLVGVINNMFTAGQSPEDADDFNDKLKYALQMILNDVNYAN